LLSIRTLDKIMNEERIYNTVCGIIIVLGLVVIVCHIIL
jgi:hypothetical protein